MRKLYGQRALAQGVLTPPDPMRWRPVAIPNESTEATDFVDGLRTMVANGDADAQTGMAAHVYVANKSMENRACVNADGEMLIVPQQGRLHITTEMGILDVKPGEVALIPRGVAFKVALLDDATDGVARGYVCENYGAHFRLPELGPIGSNGLANARDFKTPVAAFEEHPSVSAVMKSSKNTVAACGLRRCRIHPSMWWLGMAIWRRSNMTPPIS